LPYPAAAPPLAAGTRYSWTLAVPGQAAQRAEFEVVPEPDALRIRAALAELTPAALGGEAGSPLALIRAGLLCQEGLYADARRELMGAIAQDPDEPTLRQLLGHVYDRVGLADLAAQEFDEAEFLATRKP
jgi:Flp pilus assembly protein TadD